MSTFVPLSEVAEVNPRTATQGLKADDAVDFFPMAAVDADKTVTRASERRTLAQVSKGFTSFQNGDVLLAKITPCFENGKISQAVVTTPAAFGSTEFHVVRCGAKLDGRYLVHFLRRQEVRVDGERKMTGSGGQRRVPRHFLEALEIYLPPLPEQCRIASILDKADAIRVKRCEALAQLDHLSQSIFVEMFGDPATNPKGFARKKLGEIVKFEGGAQPPASTFSDSDGPDRIRLVQIRDFKSDRFKTFIPKALAKRFMQADDVMIGRYGPPVFQILRGLAGSYNVALMKAVPREGLTKEFVFHLLKEERLHRFVVANSERTAGQSGVNLDLLEGYNAYLPPMELQERFGRQMSSLSSMQTYMNAALRNAEAMFLSLQQRAFQGEL